MSTESTERQFIVVKMAVRSGQPHVDIREVTPGSCAATLTRSEAWSWANKLGQPLNVRGGSKHGFLPIFFTDLNMDRKSVGMAAANDTPQPVLAPDNSPVEADDNAQPFVAEYEWLNAQNTKGNTFLTSLKDQLTAKGSLSDKQRECIKSAMEKAQATPTRTDTAKPGESLNVPDGRYAVEREGKVMFYKVENGKAGSRWEGYTFVKVQASDDLFPVRDKDARKEILSAIASDPKEAAIRYGKELGKCWRCSKTLTNGESREAGMGKDCREAVGW